MQNQKILSSLQMFRDNNPNINIFKHECSFFPLIIITNVFNVIIRKICHLHYHIDFFFERQRTHYHENALGKLKQLLDAREHFENLKQCRLIVDEHMRYKFLYLNVYSFIYILRIHLHR